ncbi:MAG: ComEA family DNA-binding protein [Gemmatimonadetes bacterium]|nr:ComEA family DNA-binding protein [Gemmatimonadota bacterium]
MTLARTIVAWREAHGPFGSLAALDAVPGVGPGLLARLEPHVRFSGTPRAAVAGGGALVLLAPGKGAPAADGPLVRLSTATAEELARLPHIGPGLAARIVAYRERHGAFAAVDSLVRVPGIGPATLARIRDRLAP